MAGIFEETIKSNNRRGGREYMQLEIAIQEKVNAIVSNGTVEAMIEKHISSTVDSILKGMLNDYSDFGKQVKEAIGKKLELNLSKLNIDCYTGMMCQVIEQAMNGSVLDAAKDKVKAHVAEVLEQIEKKHWKLSEIVHKYINSLFGDDAKADVEYKEEAYGNYIHLGERSKSKSSYSTSKQHDITIHMNKKDGDKVFAVTIHGKNVSPLHSGSLNHFEVFLMQLWVNGCTVEIDEDEAQGVADRESYED